MKKSSALYLIAIFLLVACTTPTTTEKDTSMTQTEQQSTIQQSPADLLTGVHNAICYSGFRSGQHPDRGDGAVNPSEAEILEDLQILSSLGFKLIRMYDCGENSQDVLRVIKENSLDIKVLQGVWLKAELSAHETCAWLTEPIPQETLDANKIRNGQELERGIMLANKYPDIIAAVNVGNEALVEWNDHKVDVDTIISYVKRVQSAIEQPVTVADNYEWWANSGASLAAVVDFVSLHVYPVWEGKDIDEGMSYSIANVQRVKDSIPEAKIVITEAGWASVASEFGERASEDKQLEYYRDLMQWSADNNITTFFFEAFDEDWKGNPDNMMGAEKHWGLFTVDRKPKKVVSELLMKKGQ
jgi:exo-beta-1,3-glucanase (GH17 family)